MIEIELEKTYLAKALPQDLASFPHKEVVDIYVPEKADHPILRMRKKGNSFEITKKQPVHGNDSSEQSEHTIKLSEEEFAALSKSGGKIVSKMRYDYIYEGMKAEVDVFTGDLSGLVLVDFEFSDPKKKDAFKMPSFCLADVTQDKVFAGGMLCGKKYPDISTHLKTFGYAPLTLTKI